MSSTHVFSPRVVIARSPFYAERAGHAASLDRAQGRRTWAGIRERSLWGAIRSARADRGRKEISSACDRRELRTFSRGRAFLLLLAPAQNDSVLLSRHGFTRLDTQLDGPGILRVRNSVYPGIWSGFRVACGGTRARAFWTGHLSIYGSDSALRDRANFHSRDDHYADAGYSDLDRNEPADVPALRELHLDRMVHAATNDAY